MAGSDLYERIYAVVRQIPYGRVTSYGAIARFIGSPKSARMVGYAMHASVGMEGIAAHRVLNRSGLLTGKHHFGGSHMMEQLLISEGVEVEDDRVVDLKKYFWDPSLELDRNKYL